MATQLNDARQPSSSLGNTILLSLIGELLLCAEKGSNLRDDTVTAFAAGDHDRYLNAEAIRLLRNTVCHPAALSPAYGGVAAWELLDLVENEFHDEIWPPRARVDLRDLATREVTFFALRCVDNIGQWMAARWRLRGFRSRPAHSFRGRR